MRLLVGLAAAVEVVVVIDRAGEAVRELCNFGRRDVNDCQRSGDGRRSESGRRRDRSDRRDGMTMIGKEWGEEEADERGEPS